MNKIMFLTALKGSPLSIIVSMFLFQDYNNQVFSEDFFSNTTGYSSKTIRKSLLYLESINLIFKKSRYSGYFPSDYLLSLFSTTTTTATIEGNRLLSEENEKVAEEFTARPVNFTAVNIDVIEYLKLKNVGEPTRTQLSILPWVDLSYIKSHFNYAFKRSDPIGLVIHRIKAHDPAPKSPEDNQVDIYKRCWLKEIDR